MSNAAIVIVVDPCWQSYNVRDMDRFVALPVGQGDAFFLQHGAFSALVDGGRSVRRLPRLFSTHLKDRHVDVLVCTHNDADHANGILGFLRSELRCNEVWLPALWCERLRDLLDTPNEFVKELAANVATFNLPEGDVDSDRWSLEKVANLLVDGYPEREIVATQDAAMPLEGMEHDNGQESIWNWHLDHPLTALWCLDSPKKFGLFLEAMSAAKRIREIAVACTHRNVPIHWFQYCQDLNRSCFEDSTNDSLIPINSVRVATTPDTRSALNYISLSTANRLSLVFCSPSSKTCPGVVFTADSDLRFASNIPWRLGMIVTAPHHGSEANGRAYSHVACEIDEAGGLFWVRSDGKFKNRPGASYCALPGVRRFCTLCRQTRYQTQAVKFRISAGCWAPCQSVRSCSCDCPKR